ncbi:NAC domain-containing protein 104-like [Salvia miltiorrhiza]|uniref:NAC domain-containing protein 104-like n=1 Tax=Salvia miltiorrhiza TaxID=226208 RepID=UPI0025AC26A9|nr:NAC domain-containing protein 104-like [Salvia miltiorrhiza]
MAEVKMVLPPGFQFDPTDEELIVSFLNRRAANLPCYPNIIPDLDSYTAHPWGLHERAFRSKTEWYFFSELKQNRATEKGFWKETGLSEAIFTSNGDEVGIKNFLVFCGDGVHTNWIMEEYRSTTSQTQLRGLNEWVICRVREGKLFDCEEKISCDDDGVELSYLDEVFFSMDGNDQDDEITFPT